MTLQLVSSNCRNWYVVVVVVVVVVAAAAAAAVAVGGGGGGLFLNGVDIISCWVLMIT